MRVAHLCTQDYRGGAARSAYRIHSSLRMDGVNSVMMVRDKITEDESVIKIKPESLDERAFYNDRQCKIEACEAQFLKSLAHGHYFKSDWGKESLCLANNLLKADLLHLHWVSNNYIDYQTFFSTEGLSLPIVWRLPDMNPVTGGCHFSGECEGYKVHCGACPAITSDDVNDLSRDIHERKSNALLSYGGAIEFVATNDWMRRIIQSSSIGKHCSPSGPMGPKLAIA